MKVKAKNKIIIIEGIDRVGKTTLATKIKEHLGCKSFKDNYAVDFNKISNEAIETKFAMLLQTLPLIGGVVVDRFHMTEYVYNKFRGKEFPMYEEIDKQLADLDVILILVYSEDIKRSSEEHGSDLSLHEKEFMELFFKSKIKQKCFIKYSDFKALF